MTPIPIITTQADLRNYFQAHPQRPRAVVMTLGGLHEGHAALMDVARDRVGADGLVVATIFLNPLQFAAHEDLGKYPQTFDADIEMCRKHGVDVLFAPTRSEIYPTGDPMVMVDPGELGSRFEGVERPTFFTGVLTVVSKLLNIVEPDIAPFGEKDYQQLTLVRRLVDDLSFPVQIVGVPIVRDSDGLALSSRNSYLSATEREHALAIPRALSAGQTAADAGASPEEICAAAMGELDSVAGVRPSYVAVTDPVMGPAPQQGEGRLVVTAIVGTTRLLDNVQVSIKPRATQ